MKIEKFILACGDIVAFGSPEFISNKIVLYAIDPMDMDKEQQIPVQIDISNIEKHTHIDRALDKKNPFIQTRIEMNRADIVKLRDAMTEALNADIEEKKG